MDDALQSRKSAELQGVEGGLWGVGLGYNVCVIEFTLYVTCSELAVEILVGGEWMSGDGSEAEGLAVWQSLATDN